MTWLSQYADVISSLTNLLIIVIWTFYALLFYKDFSSRHRPRMLIHQAPATTADAECLLINMSQSTMDVACVLVVGYSSEQMVRQPIGDYQKPIEERQSSTPASIQFTVKQGPLSPGEFLILGTFGELLAALGNGSDHDSIQALEVRVVAYFGTQDAPIAAYRRFSIDRQGTKARQTRVRAESEQTHHLIRFWQRRTAQQWMQECMDL